MRNDRTESDREEARSIATRLREIIPGAAVAVDERLVRVLAHAAPEARGAMFELRVLNRFPDDILGTVRLDVSRRARGPDVDVAISTTLHIEMMSPLQEVTASAQITLEMTPVQLEEALNAGFHYSRDITRDKARAAFTELRRKALRKEAVAFCVPTWFLLDGDSTDWLEPIGKAAIDHRRDLREHVQSLLAVDEELMACRSIRAAIVSLQRSVLVPLVAATAPAEQAFLQRCLRATSDWILRA